MILSQNNAKLSNSLKKCFMPNGMKILWGQFYLESFIHIFIGIEVSITNDPSSISPTLHSLPCHIILKVFGSTEKVIVERCWLVITYFLPLFFDNGQNHVQRRKEAIFFFSKCKCVVELYHKITEILIWQWYLGNLKCDSLKVVELLLLLFYFFFRHDCHFQIWNLQSKLKVW